MEKLLTVEEAAEMTRLKPRTIYVYAERRKIPHIKLGTRLLFDREALQNWINSNTVPTLQTGVRRK